MTTEPKRPRAKRRNFQRDLENLKNYCEIKVDVLRSLAVPGGPQALDNESQIRAFEDVLKRLS